MHAGEDRVGLCRIQESIFYQVISSADPFWTCEHPACKSAPTATINIILNLCAADNPHSRGCTQIRKKAEASTCDVTYCCVHVTQTTCRRRLGRHNKSRAFVPYRQCNATRTNQKSKRVSGEKGLT
jgi:hypothetical protein